MAATTRVKAILNGLLRPLNLRLESLTAARREEARLASLAAGGYFERPAFPLVDAIRGCDPGPVLRALPEFSTRFESFRMAKRNEVGYSFDNAYFSSPDAEVLYAMIRLHRPVTIVEIGGGNSTCIARQAIRDGGLHTRLISVDPRPRIEIAGMADELLRVPVEESGALDRIRSLKAGDILFVDSSHKVLPGSDVASLFLTVFPQLASGVLVHVHDVFLPWDYPVEWVLQERYGFDEQYLLQALLAGGGLFQVLWAGHWLQRTLTGFESHFPNLGGRRAQSFWMRRGA